MLFLDKKVKGLARDKTVIVSDLHIDTWSPSTLFHGKTKQEHFLEFLDWITPTTANFVLNGDLFDAPPDKDGDLWPTYETILNRLALLAHETNVHYFIGNHDLGLWGLKIRNLWNLNISYPSYPDLSIQAQAGPDEPYLYFEHGHNYDPALALYIRNAVGAMVPRGLLWNIRDAIARLFHRFSHRQEAGSAPGPVEPNVTRFQDAALRAAQRRHPASGEKSGPLGLDWKPDLPDIETWLWRAVGPLIQRYYDPLNWGAAACDVFEDFCREHPEKKIKLIVFGHTHRPDEQTVTSGDRQALYLNSGDWCEPVLEKDPDTHHSSFIIIDRHGDPERDGSGNAVRDYITEVGERTTEPAEEPSINSPVI